MELVEVLVYSLSLSFQVAGAVLLIIKYWGKTKDRIVDEYFPGSNIIERDEEDNIKLEKEKVQVCARNIYDNRMAFVFIAIGYILSIFGSMNSISKIYILILVILFTVIIIVIEKKISMEISKRYYIEDIIMSYDEVAYIADTVPTDEEIKALFN